jgi:hypothetical protein
VEALEREAGPALAAAQREADRVHPGPQRPPIDYDSWKKRLNEYYAEAERCERAALAKVCGLEGHSLVDVVWDLAWSYADHTDPRGAEDILPYYCVLALLVRHHEEERKNAL